MELLPLSPLLDEETQREHKARNVLHSMLLMGGISTVVGLACWLIWGVPGVLFAFVAIAGLYAFAPRIPPETVMLLYRAKPVAPGQAGQLAGLLRTLSERASLPRTPRLYIVPSLTLNAFAVGSPDNSAVAVTEGLLRRLTMREIAGVLAHEVSHVRNNDLWVMGLADVMTRFVQSLSYVALSLAVFNMFGMLAGEDGVSWWAILLLYLAPAVSSLLQLGLSRAREFDADLEGAMLTGDPLGLASALRRLERYTGRIWEDLAFPVPARRVPQPSLLRSHPATEERIARLLALGGSAKASPITIVDEPMVSLVGWGPNEMRPRYRWPGLWF